MIILTVTSIYSGAVGAIVGGIVSLIGYMMTTRVQSKNGKEAIKMQKEVAKMQKDQKLFYESRLHWANETRKIIADFVDHCFQFDILVKDINSIQKRANDGKSVTLTEQSDLLAKNANNSLRAKQLLSTLNKEVTMIRLYLFHKDDEYERRILETIHMIEHNMDIEDGVDGKLMNQQAIFKLSKDTAERLRDYLNRVLVTMR